MNDGDDHDEIAHDDVGTSFPEYMTRNGNSNITFSLTLAEHDELFCCITSIRLLSKSTQAASQSCSPYVPRCFNQKPQGRRKRSPKMSAAWTDARSLARSTRNTIMIST